MTSYVIIFLQLTKCCQWWGVGVSARWLVIGRWNTPSSIIEKQVIVTTIWFQMTCQVIIFLQLIQCCQYDENVSEMVGGMLMECASLVFCRCSCVAQCCGAFDVHCRQNMQNNLSINYIFRDDHKLRNDHNSIVRDVAIWMRFTIYCLFTLKNDMTYCSLGLFCLIGFNPDKIV
jgi:hypothetical protein